MTETPEFFVVVAKWSAALLELLGIVRILMAGGMAGVTMMRNVKEVGADPKFDEIRLRLARGILLGLEFLVAADIIRTVTVKPTFSSVGILAGIVAIRTFLSFALEVETTGRWPWARKDS